MMKKNFVISMAMMLLAVVMLGSYQEYQQKNDLRQIEISLTNDEDTYIYYIKVFDNGNSSIDVQSRQRESISYSGEITW